MILYDRKRIQIVQAAVLLQIGTAFAAPPAAAAAAAAAPAAAPAAAATKLNHQNDDEC